MLHRWMMLRGQWRASIPKQQGSWTPCRPQTVCRRALSTLSAPPSRLPIRGGSIASVGLAGPGASLAGGSAAAATGGGKGTSTFYADEGTTFSSLGLSPLIEDAMRKAGFLRPSQIQADSAKPILSGHTTVIAAETGCGKTLAYLAPIMSLLLRQRAQFEERQAAWLAEAELAERQRREQSSGAAVLVPTVQRPRRYHALVLCPNGALCQQLVSVVRSLPAGISAAQVSIGSPPTPGEATDIIVATPAGLLTLLKQAGQHYGWLWTDEGLQASIRHVVLDEADVQFGKAYRNAVDQVLQKFRYGDRRRMEAQVCEELGLTIDEFSRLPRQKQAAAWKAGSTGLLETGFRTREPIPPGTTFGPYWHRQYIFVAATLPTILKCDAGTEIQRMYPDAVWVVGDLLHRSKPMVTHEWVEVSEEAATATLVRYIQSDPEYRAGRARMLVFVKDGSSADAASSCLDEAGIRNLVFHSGVPPHERSLALKVMQQQPLCCMVATDMAARGLDLPHLTHVLQLDFAPNAIDFIHRIGRTGRAGAPGKVLSLYRDSDRQLVAALQRYLKRGEPLEAAFSRARSFSRKLKRVGEFVPRGLSLEQHQEQQRRLEQEEGGQEGRVALQPQ